MIMKGFSSNHLAMAVIVVILVVAHGARVSEGVTCSPTELASCANAITTSTPPSKQCCNKIKEQKPCLCQYLNNPNLKRFINNPNARKVAATCGTPYPKC